MLQANDIHKVYNSSKQPLEVLKGVSLKIEEGKFVAVVGPSGAGKSTLLHILGGLDSPTRGEVILGGENIYNLSDTVLSKIRNEKIGFVFQFYHLLSEFTVLENVLMPVLVKADNALTQDFHAKANSLLKAVGLEKRTHHLPVELSGGEQQRVAIARALINTPEILFCDEPTGNLDSQTGEEVTSLIRRLNSENKMTVVLVTHNLELAKNADQIFHLRDGVLVN